MPISALEKYPVTAIEIRTLNFGESPRRGGEDPEHTRALADVAPENLPPITVHRQTMEVIDGRHRIRAALLNGRTHISARLIDCDRNAAFALAVRENTTHGLPLSLADRRAAALSIIAAQPRWSDRVVADQTGLSGKTVSALRAGAIGPDLPHGNARLGRDGRLRPLNSAAMRREAAELIRDRPEAGLREIARRTGLSPATVRDVRKRIVDGRDPVPARYSDEPPAQVPDPTPAAPTRSGDGPPGPADPRVLLTGLSSDPSLRFSEAGRRAVRWLRHHTVDADDVAGLAIGIPDHWATPIAHLARHCATGWLSLAEELERRPAGEEPRAAVPLETGSPGPPDRLPRRPTTLRRMPGCGRV